MLLDLMAFMRLWHNLCFIFEQEYTMLPFHLNILALGDLIPLERVSVSKIGAAQRELERTDHLVNPLLAAPGPGEKLLLLAGMDHYEALRIMGIADTVVQIIHSAADNAEFSTWYHLVKHCKPEYLLQVARELHLNIERFDGQFDYPDNGGNKQVICLFLKGESFRILAVTGELSEQANSINAFIESCREGSSYVKLYPDKAFLNSAQLFDLGELLVIPPRYSHSELLCLAKEKVLFPPDYLNVIFKNRVIGLDFPLDVLRSNVDIDEKSAFLRDLIRLRLQSENSTAYEGRVFFMGKRKHSSGKIRFDHNKADSRYEPGME